MIKNTVVLIGLILFSHFTFANNLNVQCEISIPEKNGIKAKEIHFSMPVSDDIRSNQGQAEKTYVGDVFTPDINVIFSQPQKSSGPHSRTLNNAKLILSRSTLRYETNSISKEIDAKILAHYILSVRGEVEFAVEFKATVPLGLFTATRQNSNFLGIGSVNQFVVQPNIRHTESGEKYARVISSVRSNGKVNCRNLY